MAEPQRADLDARAHFLTEQEVQDVLDAGSGQFRRWCGDGVFPGARSDRRGRWHVPAEDVQRAIETGVARYPANARQRLAFVLRSRSRPSPSSRSWLGRLIRVRRPAR